MYAIAYSPLRYRPSLDIADARIDDVHRTPLHLHDVQLYL